MPAPFARPKWLLTGLSVLIAAGCASRAEDGPKPVPESHRLLEEVVKAYQARKAYADEGHSAFRATINGQKQDRDSAVRVAFARPNKLALDLGQVRILSDGKTLTTAIPELKKHTEEPAPKAITAETLRGAAVAPLLFNGPNGVPLTVLLELLTSKDPAASILEGTRALTLEADRPVKGDGDGDASPARSLLVDQQEGPDVRLLIDPKTKLVRRIELVFDVAEFQANAPRGTKLEDLSYSWQAGTISEPKADAFAFQAPEGSEKVATFLEQHSVEDLVGKPAPEFALTILDGPGQTKTITRADLAGKVVVLDFWATWCGPCLMEMPDVQKLAESYAEAKKDVAIVALSQDNDPSDPAEVRQLVEATLKGRNITLTGTPVGMVGIDPKNEVGRAFHLEAFPTLVILDAQGIVQAVHIGVTPRETLAADIDAVLAGKSLAPAKGEGAAKP